MLQPFKQLGISYRFYALDNQLEPEILPVLTKNELFLYINFFGLKNNFINRLATHYGDALVVDNTQDFFAQHCLHGWAFNSARKSFGVPDGGYLYGPAKQLGTADRYPVNMSYSADYLIDRLRGEQMQAYAGFIAYEQTLTNEPLQISAFSASLLSQVDYVAAMAARRANYACYHESLSELNILPIMLNLESLPADTVPFCYPLLLPSGEHIDRQALFRQNIFVPTLWPDVLTRMPDGFGWERQLTRRLLPLPLDHRYGFDEVKFVVSSLRKLLVQSRR
ncbi:hypothetical protein CDA63_19060 [Hymenobacter amundsenii]|uniref:DegT/DnrJ/EryC1/StrS aminotransferase n=2 Tax=Hymenobacter amundsenii TaxID=2006685 RepID=A0A246FIQ7_9BACT|nr:hypothetical protein CDA63_19060 [Hymenobacter amundsenii]